MHVQGLRGRPPGGVPDLAHQLVAGDDPARVPDQDPQQVELLRGELELLLAHPGPVRLDVDADAVRGGRGGGFTRAAPEQGPYPGEQFGQPERLGHVVVGARVEAHHGVHLVGAGGQHEQGHGKALGAQSPGHFEAVHAGQPEVEYDQVHAALKASFERGGTVFAYLYLIALPAQGAGQGLRDGRVVLGEQYTGHGVMVVRAEERPGGDRRCLWLRYAIGSPAFECAPWFRRTPVIHHSRPSIYLSVMPYGGFALYGTSWGPLAV